MFKCYIQLYFASFLPETDSINLRKNFSTYIFRVPQYEIFAVTVRNLFCSGKFQSNSELVQPVLKDVCKGQFWCNSGFTIESKVVGSTK